MFFLGKGESCFPFCVACLVGDVLPAQELQ
jgi:hypothetical protein